MSSSVAMRATRLFSVSSKRPEHFASKAEPLANISRKVFQPLKGVTRRFMSDSEKTDDKSCINKEDDFPVDEFGNKILYRGTQDLVVRLLFGASSFNFVYWTYYTMSSYYYQGVVIEGVNLGGDIRWGAVGAFATGLMFYATKMFKDNACMMVYSTGDRIGFQMHNFLGGSGRRVEASPGNVRLLGEGRSTRFGSSFIPLRVKGMGKNVLIDEKGKFYHNNELRRLLQEQGELSADAVAADADSEEYFVGKLDSKEKRIAFKASKRGKKQRFL